MNVVIMIVLYLLGAEALEFGVLPQFKLLSVEYQWIFDLHLLALGGIMIGMLRGELPGMLAAAAAALIFGLSHGSNAIGASLVSFTIAAYLAGLIAQLIRRPSFLVRLFWMTSLLILESMIWCFVRRFFWTGLPVDVPWLSAAVTALFGAILYGLLARRYRVDFLRLEMDDL